MRSGVIIQARLGSTRFPEKILAELAGEPVISHVVKRSARSLGTYRVAVPIEDEPVVRAALPRQYSLTFGWDGNEMDCAGRLLACAEDAGWSWFTRVCADSPLLDPNLLSAIDWVYGVANGDYVSAQGFPHGQQVQVYNTEFLRRQYPTMNAEQREHVKVTPDQGAFFHSGFPPAVQSKWPSLTVDYPEDIPRLERIMKKARGTSWRDYVSI